MDSKLGLIVQLNGVFLVTILSLVLRRSLKFKALRYWTTAWLCLSFSLIALRLAFDLAGLAPVLFTYHLLGEYIFGFMLAAGCRSLGTDAELSQRAELLILPLVALSVVLPLVTLDLNDALFYQSFVMSGLFAVALIILRRSGIKTLGSKLMGISLALLAVEPFLFIAAVSIGPYIPAYIELSSYRAVTSLVAQSGLGLGTVVILIEKAIADFRNANAELHEAHQRLEELVHTDPLTAAFNRHAFYGFVNRGNEEGRTISGCVGFFDIDDLKGINDRFGHAAGDAAIRLVARAIRNIIRAEDLIYRWGGDEFFVIMVSMDADFAESRMVRLPELLTDVSLEGADEPYSIGVSWGFKDFIDSAELEEAIKIADREMYRRKHERKSRTYNLPELPRRPELTAL